MKSKGTKKVKDSGPWLADERLLGELNENTEGIVMDSVVDREKHKPRIKIVRTENLNFFAGESTVAIFRIKKKDPEIQSVPLLAERF